MPDIKFDTTLTATLHFHRLADGLGMMKSIGTEVRPQAAAQIVHGDPQPMQLLENADAVFGNLEKAHHCSIAASATLFTWKQMIRSDGTNTIFRMNTANATFHLSRQVPVELPYDVVIAGGGPAGAAAAVSAARLGARTLLIEATGCLGGMGTSGLVTAFDPMANGETGLVGGFQREVVEELYRRGFLGTDVTPEYWLKRFLTWIPFNAEGYKLVLDEMMLAAGVETRFFTRVIDVDVDSRNLIVNGVVIHNIEGYSFIPAKAFIDCTGDAVLADLCGCDCWEAGRDTPRIMPATLPSLFAGIDWDRVRAYRNKEGHEQFTDIIRKGIAEGMFVQPDPFLVGMSQIGPSVGYLNGGHLFNLNALRSSELSKNVMLGRRIAQDYLAFYRKYIPGCEKMEHVTTASLIGVRESRRIKGEYVLCLDDYLARRQFPDQIGVFNKFVDIHPYDTSEAEYARFLLEKDKNLRLNPGECFGLPYGILVPKGWQNLWVAGRCVSSDVRVHGSIRVQPACSMMGQAAGTAAVQSIHTGEPACDLDTRQLVETLRHAGAYLPQSTTEQKMTRQDSADALLATGK